MPAWLPCSTWLNHLVIQILRAVAANPSDAVFNHYLFEAIASIVMTYSQHRGGMLIPGAYCATIRSCPTWRGGVGVVTGHQLYPGTECGGLHSVINLMLIICWSMLVCITSRTLEVWNASFRYCFQILGLLLDSGDSSTSAAGPQIYGALFDRWGSRLYSCAFSLIGIFRLLTDSLWRTAANVPGLVRLFSS